jgi:hypothetical protein
MIAREAVDFRYVYLDDKEMRPTLVGLMYASYSLIPNA